MAILTRIQEFFNFILIISFIQLGCISLLISTIISNINFLDYAEFTALLCNFHIYIKKGNLYKKKCLYFFNHRSWSDFFMDLLACSQVKNISALGRMAVYWGLPYGSAVMHMYGNCIFFKRGDTSQNDLNNKIDKSEILLIESLIDNYFNNVDNGHLIVYPEGTRNPHCDILNLKTGMMRVAYRRLLPVQIIHLSNKQNILAEKSFSSKFGLTSEIVYGPVIDPADVKDEETFINLIKNAWVQTAQDLESTEKGYEKIPFQIWKDDYYQKIALLSFISLILIALTWMFPSMIINLLFFYF